MANEFEHVTTGVDLSQVEYEGILAHKFDGQATGDMMYASSAVQLSRLAAGAVNTVLHMAGGLPVWSVTLAWLTLPAPIINGIVTTTGLTLPTFILGGAITANNQVIEGLQYIRFSATDSIRMTVENLALDMFGGTGWTNGAYIRLAGKDSANNSAFILYTPNADNSLGIERLRFTGDVATAVATWASVTHTGLKLSGALDCDSQDINNVAAPGAAGDPLIKGTAITITEMAALTTDKIWQGVANRPVEVDMPGAATKEFFVPFFFGNDVTTQYGANIDSAGDKAFVNMLVPQDFTSIDDIEIIFAPKATGANMKVAIYCRYGAYNGGENQNVHDEFEVARDIGATVANQNLAHSIADLVNGGPLAVGDFLQIQILYDITGIASNTYMKGVRFKYS